MNSYTVTVLTHDFDEDFTDELIVEAESQKRAESIAWARVQEQRGETTITFDAIESIER